MNFRPDWGRSGRIPGDHRSMSRTLSFVTLALLVLAAAAARAGDKHVVELFTSQGCYSCPPADRLLGKLVDARDDVIALEFHVDYWDDLVYGLAGRWEDPFSDGAYTRRQRRYKVRGLEGNNGVYTPQVVVDGRAAAVGSKRGAIEALLSRPAPAAAGVELRGTPASLHATVSGVRAGAAEVWLYRFDLRRVTRVGGGENKGKTLTNHHVVRQARRLGEWQGGEREYVVDDLYLNEDEGCAVVVQRRDQGEILGAASCRS